MRRNGTHKAANKPRQRSGARKVRPSAKPGRNGLTVEQKLAELKRRLLEISDLMAAGAVLAWDHATYMPKAGARARGRQGAVLHRLVHERQIDPALGQLIDELAPYGETLAPDADDAALLRVARREFDKAIKVPADYVARASELGSASYDAWTRARPANDFAAMAPFLEQMLELRREYAGLLRALRPHRRSADRRP